MPVNKREILVLIGSDLKQIMLYEPKLVIKLHKRYLSLSSDRKIFFDFVKPTKFANYD